MVQAEKEWSLSELSTKTKNSLHFTLKATRTVNKRAERQQLKRASGLVTNRISFEHCRHETSAPANAQLAYPHQIRTRQA